MSCGNIGASESGTMPCVNVTAAAAVMPLSGLRIFRAYSNCVQLSDRFLGEIMHGPTVNI